MIKVAAALLAVLKPCERRARPTCRGTRKSTCDQEPPPAASGEHSSTPSSSDPVNVVDDDDVEIISIFSLGALSLHGGAVGSSGLRNVEVAQLRF